ncbi:hypothetical protein [Hoeflea sp.]|uniref:hypothetical protein n=1 Tax=Hoeflea sp. TaxID=1940281 RepID=UPI0019AA253A|nr:hypothetical protein [Hoeflea sp.]MBC7284353.1 hypothetical protein [Hoeflea sp.]
MAMDRPTNQAYDGLMFSRFVAILAMLSIAVVTMVTSAHAARMNADSHGVIHTIEMMHAHGNSDRPCGEIEPCNAAGSEICAFVCAGVSVYLLLPAWDTGPDAEPGRLDLPPGTALTSRTPGLSEPPPKLTLL